MGVIRAGALVAAAAAALLPLWVPAAQAVTDTAVQNYGACLLGRGTGDLLILMDQSPSVASTDPPLAQYDNQPARTRGAKALVQQLARDTEQANVDLNVQVAGFGYGFVSQLGWTSLTKSDATEEIGRAIDRAATTDGFETDYWSGLEGARTQFAEQAKSDKGRCQALLWFSDGRLKLASRSESEAAGPYKSTKPYAPGTSLVATGNNKVDQDRLSQVRTAAEDDLCRPAGLANQLRAGGVTLLGIGLQDAGEPKKSDSDEFALMKRVVTNERHDCGTLQSPPGHFWLAEGFDDMLAAFDEIAHPAGQATRDFVLDDLLTGVHVRGQGASGLSYALVSPSGERLSLPVEGATSGRFEGTPGVEVTWAWPAPDLITVDLNRSSTASWAGRWRVEITDQDRTQAGTDPTVSFRADLYPTWAVDPDTLVSGGVTSARLGLARADGQALRVEDVPGTLHIDDTITDTNGVVHPLASVKGKSDLTEPIEVDLSSIAPGPATVTSSLVYTTAEVDGRSTRLDPQTKSFTITVRPPEDRGRLESSLAFGSLEGPADTTTSIDVTGPSCVWLTEDPEVLSSPAEVVPVFSSEHHSSDTCLKVDRGSHTPFQVRLTTAAEGNGPLNGTLPLHLAPEDEPDRAVVQRVEFSGDMSRRLNAGTATGAFALALVAGIGLPIAGLYLAKYLGAKIPGRVALESMLLPIDVAGGDVTTSGRSLTLTTLPAAVPVDLLRKGSRSVVAAGSSIQTRMGISPFSPGWAEAVLDGQHGASSTSSESHGRRHAARLPLAIHNTWALFHDPTGPADHGSLLLLRGLDVSDADRASQLEDARRRAPSLLAALHAQENLDVETSTPTVSSGNWSAGSFGNAVAQAPPDDQADGPRFSERPDVRPGSPTPLGQQKPPTASGGGDNIDWTQGSFGSDPPSDPPRWP